METILVGKGGTVSHVPQPLLATLDKCLTSLLNDARTTPQNIVEGMWYTASILEHVGPPLTIVKNPYGG
jgi:hypothetical protein